MYIKYLHNVLQVISQKIQQYRAIQSFFSPRYDNRCNFNTLYAWCGILTMFFLRRIWLKVHHILMRSYVQFQLPSGGFKWACRSFPLHQAYDVTMVFWFRFSPFLNGSSLAILFADNRSTRPFSSSAVILREFLFTSQSLWLPLTVGRLAALRRPTTVSTSSLDNLWLP